MSDEKERTVSVLGAPAAGAIDPDARVAKGEISDDIIDREAQEISGHYEWVGGELREKAIPKWCVDGRTDKEGHPLAPNAAGGTYSLVIGDALIDAPALIANGETSASHGKKMFTSLLSNGYEVGAHTDNHANETNCGCGACQKQGEIIGFIRDNIAELSQKAAGLGVDISDTLQSKIKTNANDLIEAEYVSSGGEMLEVVEEVAGPKSIQTLQDAHNEVILAVNVSKPGKTLARRSLSDEFGNEYQAFNLDVWALKNGIDAISTNPDEANEKFAASILYNLATACVLAGPSLRVVVV